MTNLKDIKSPRARQLWLDLHEAVVTRTSREQFIKHMSAIRRKYDSLYGARASERDLDLVPLPTLTEKIEAQVATAIAALTEEEKPKRMSENDRLAFTLLAQVTLGDEGHAL